MSGVIKTLSDDEVTVITSAFRDNSQLYNAGHLVSSKNRLIKFLNRVSSKTYEKSGRDIKLISIDKEIPF